MEDDLNLVLGNLGSWFLVCNIVAIQLDEIWKTTSFCLKEDNLIFLFKEATFIILNGRGPQFFFQMEDDFNLLTKDALNVFLNQRERNFYFMEDDFKLLE